MPGYRGPADPFDHKYRVLQRYKFNIVVEPAVVECFITEKILDSFLTLTVPVYLGPETTNRYIDSDCFINIRDFSSVDSLVAHLIDIETDEYNEYVKNIRAKRRTIFTKFSTRENFSETIYQWYNSSFHTDIGLTTKDYRQIERDLSNLELQTSNYVLSDIKRRYQLRRRQLEAAKVYFSRRVDP